MKIAVNLNGNKMELNMSKGIAYSIQKYGREAGPVEMFYCMAAQLERAKVASHIGNMKMGEQAVIYLTTHCCNFTVEKDCDGLDIVNIKFSAQPRPNRYNYMNPWVVVMPEAVEILSSFSYGRMAALV